MTVSELIDRLSDFNPGAEVRIATQPSWPLAHHVGNVVDSADIDPDDDTEDDIVWVVAGDRPDRPYAPRACWDAAHR